MVVLTTLCIHFAYTNVFTYTRGKLSYCWHAEVHRAKKKGLVPGWSTWVS